MAQPECNIDLPFSRLSESINAETQQGRLKASCRLSDDLVGLPSIKNGMVKSHAVGQGFSA
ncbi:hypothetical protein [Neisseria sicca]